MKFRKQILWKWLLVDFQLLKLKCYKNSNQFLGKKVTLSKILKNNKKSCMVWWQKNYYKIFSLPTNQMLSWASLQCDYEFALLLDADFYTIN